MLRGKQSHVNLSENSWLTELERVFQFSWGLVADVTIAMHTNRPSLFSLSIAAVTLRPHSWYLTGLLQKHLMKSAVSASLTKKTIFAND